GLARLLFRLGDAASWLGWRPPVRTTALRELTRGAVGDPAPLAALGLRPRDLEAALLAGPASLQEGWVSALHLPKPVRVPVLSAFWIVTGLISLGPGWREAVDVMRDTGTDATLSAVSVAAGALADIVIGGAIAWRPTARHGLIAAIGLSLIYAAFATLLAPA